MNSNQIRQQFFDFFRSKGHEIVPSAPMVIKNDPTLMFTNAGMNQFKDIFLGNAPAKFKRVADTQKCLRVSGKHNDLEEVGVDTYHHTMFEMLGNWSFGDYFKKDAIAWAWELLTEVYKIDKDRLYVTVFEGSKDDNLDYDTDSYNYWKQFIAEDRIINGNKKDNFWEMGDTGPCGPCSEIHVDIRSDEERKKVDGKSLVNASHPHVIEIWNNVFMEFNRKADGSLEKLPAQHVDTGMGFERLCMVLQGKQSNYDSDIFQDIIKTISIRSRIDYKQSDAKTDIAMRVIADHLRAISFAIADGQLPSNNKAGYVIRRILRRAVRYGYSFLNFKEPFLCDLVPVLVAKMGDTFTELKSQEELIKKVIREEENSFLKTLGNGILRFDEYRKTLKGTIIDGKFAFELFDTYGFPIDLTDLLARENKLEVDMKVFEENLQEQKTRSRAAAAVDTDDWVVLNETTEEEFIGYDFLETDVQVAKYRKVKSKGKEQFQLVFDKTPFYAESGGQVGDTGVLENGNDKIFITDTKKENNLIIHFADKLPVKMEGSFKASVNTNKRLLTANNHSATHLLHAAMKQVLGKHVEQKGSLVNDEYLRFDFSHFAKVTDEEIEKIEAIVNEKIRENIAVEIKQMPIDDARKLGAMALFGEKYGDIVRVVTMDKNFSIELCGGTHVKATGQIGMFKITSESAIAAGVRRIEAITAVKAEEFFKNKLKLIAEVSALLKNPADLVKSVQQLSEQNNDLQKQVESLYREKAKSLKTELLAAATTQNGIRFIFQKVNLDSGAAIKDLCFELKQPDNTFIVLGAEVSGKPQLFVAVSDNLVKDKKLHAGNIVKELAKEINGGGGGQPFFATAGGTEAKGLEKALEAAKKFLN
ncbi:MAG: Alanine--tRNA ligase [Bacteroidia bacterium]|nr:Alanine--tRNA ligase [Bacteroidia bacterium]